MVSKVIVEKNAYHDSVTLMSLSSKILSNDGVEEAVVSMGTEMNKDLLRNTGMMTEEADAATDNDLIIAVQAETEDILNETIESVFEELSSKKQGSSRDANQPVGTFHAAMERLPEANLAIISVPGEYAAREARQALNNGLHVLIFSDNVSVEDERSLKELGREKGLLVMGPDCGTAIINNIGLCFANHIDKGEIGLVAASGTGLQEVTVQINRMGYGISQAIGTGGRDLYEEVGGIMMIEGMKALNKDENTKVITLISKPPAKSVQEKVLAEIKKLSKPVVVCFLDGDKEAIEASGAAFAPTLIEGARQSIKQLNPSESFDTELTESAAEWVKKEAAKLASSQQYVRGLFCGGTLTSESLSIMRSMGAHAKSNVAKKKEEKLEDVSERNGHILLDMGDDVFTEGRPHPMIEPALRNERILQEAADSTTAVLLLDFEIGYGSHEDPVGESYDTLKEAKRIAEEDGRHLSIVAYICGTANDKQGYESQKQKLQEADVFVAESNETATKVAAMISQGEVA